MDKDTRNDFVNDLLKAAGSSYRAKDSQKIEIACRKNEFEKVLDEMWMIYMENPRQIIEYNRQVESIKDCGCRVLRNSAGKHRILI